MDIIYLEHPVSAEDKAKFKSEGKRIIDAIYKPAELSEVKEDVKRIKKQVIEHSKGE